MIIQNCSESSIYNCNKAIYFILNSFDRARIFKQKRITRSEEFMFIAERFVSLLLNIKAALVKKLLKSKFIILAMEIFIRVDVTVGP